MRFDIVSVLFIFYFLYPLFPLTRLFEPTLYEVSRALKREYTYSVGVSCSPSLKGLLPT